jgi:hypothetical protein
MKRNLMFTMSMYTLQAKYHGVKSNRSVTIDFN